MVRFSHAEGGSQKAVNRISPARLRHGRRDRQDPLDKPDIIIALSFL
jgi:hypothetical protein